jgi:DNA invertase Pin-like site-specific DNA recombinase
MADKGAEGEALTERKCERLSKKKLKGRNEGRKKRGWGKGEWEEGREKNNREGEMRVLKLSGKGALVTAKGKTQTTQVFESRVKRNAGNSKGNASNSSAWDLLSVFVTVF